MKLIQKRNISLPFLQGVYFIGTGIWPLLHMKSFLKVTGPKRDLWLVKTVGMLVAAIGATLARGALKDKSEQDLSTLGICTAAGLAGIDMNYSLKGRISKIYLLDAVAELALLSLWLARKA